MSRLLTLGKYVCIPILTEWLTASCIQALDISICNHTNRRTYFDWVREYFTLFVPLLSINRIPIHLLGDAYNWATTRFFDIEVLMGTVEIGAKSVKVFSECADLFNQCAVIAPRVKRVEICIYCGDLSAAFDLLIACQLMEVLNCRRAPLLMYKRIADKCTNLTTIDFSGCYEKISEFAFVKILKNNDRLTSINVSVCFVGSSFMQALIVCCRNLKCLNIRRCTSLNPRDRLLLAIHGRLQLESLSCTGFENFTMKCFLQYQSLLQLNQLDLSESHLLNGNGLSLLDLCCPNLSYVNLGDCARVDDTTLTSVGGLGHLRTCLLMLIPDITASAVMEVASRCSQLHTLSLYKTDRGFECLKLADLGKVCPSLTDLSLVDIRSVWTIDMMMIFSHGKEFRKLNISVNSQLLDQMFEEGAAYLRNLTDLNISSCRGITSKTLIALHSCPKLKKLNCVNCSRLTISDINSLISSSVDVTHDLE